MRRGERSGCNRRPPLVAALGERGSAGGAARRSRVAEQRGGGGGGRRAQRVDAAGGKGRAARAAGLGGSALRQSGSSAGRYRRGGSPSARGRSRSPPAAAPGGAGAAGTARTAGPHGPPLPGRSGCGRGGSGGRDNGLLSSYLRRPEGGGGVLGLQTCLRLGAGRGHLSAFPPPNGRSAPGNRLCWLRGYSRRARCERRNAPESLNSEREGLTPPPPPAPSPARSCGGRPRALPRGLQPPTSRPPLCGALCSAALCAEHRRIRSCGAPAAG